MLNINRSEAAGGYYRPDIDGLRAIAVLPVVLYHYRVPGFSGGYVGVDIFFVISGFLITSLIHAEIREQRFSILRFYERRVRRILPALFALLAVVTVLALIILFPRDLRQYASSVIATALFASNIEFWQRAGYFDTAADLKPLLHTWSLAVEEQFYLVWPAMLFAVERWGRRYLLAAVCLILVLSLGESIREVAYAPTAAFYLLPSRMWELMLGAALAVGRLRPPENRWFANALAMLGLVLIGWSVGTYTADTPFPGLAAVPACLGAALLIYVGGNRDVLAARLLSTPAFVFVGLISYSLYLWHWPLYVFAKYYLSAPPDAAQAVLLILASIALSWASYRFVEQPFRRNKTVFTGRRLFAMAGGAIAACVALGAVVIAGNGLPQRYPADIRTLLAGADDREHRRAHCFNLSPDQVRAGRLCRIGDPSAKVDFVFWGDSHADALLPAIDLAAKAKRRAGLFASRSACPPLIGVERVDAANGQCRAFNDAVAKRIAASDIREVILAARWARDAEGTGYGDEDQATAFLADDQSHRRSIAENHAVFLRGLSRTLAWLDQAGKKVVIVGPVPEVSRYVPETLAKVKYFGLRQDVRPTVAEFERRQHFVLAALAEAATRYHATMLYPHQWLCTVGRCAVEQNGRALYVDTNHLSSYGTRLLAPKMKAAF
ncbi:MAG TPA: acyltransferase family protein [Rhizomicrobium sp.]|jgi:peptidoglycan/LPS O-acetylase OafA/YrhL